MLGIIRPRRNVWRSLFCAIAAIALTVSFEPSAARAQLAQQGGKLVGTPHSGSTREGSAVALSGDGNTAIDGGFADNSEAGAVWIFTRSSGTWSQQAKLVGTGATGPEAAQQGTSVALSLDGNTAIEGAPQDGNSIGAAWVFTRSGTTWTQQGNKLVGSGTAGVFSSEGQSVALSGDGNTAAIGGPDDNGVGAVWIFTRSGGVWSQVGSKLVASGAMAGAGVGTFIALSTDGKTLIVGAPGDNGGNGGVFVFTQSGGVWTQQGGELLGSGAIDPAGQGTSVAVSSDGNTFVEGGPGDNTNLGATWVFTRSGTTWSQQGGKLIGMGSVGMFLTQGTSVGLSGDGNTLIEGGPGDNSFAGASWMFTRTAGVWTQLGSKLVGTGADGSADQGTAVALSASGGTAIVGGDNDKLEIGAVWFFAGNALTVSVSGSGTVTSTDGSINCTASCSSTYLPGYAVTLTASAGAGFSFAGWSGAGCSGTSNCVVTMNAANSVTANFVPNTAGNLTLVAAVLPLSRSVEVGATPTAFATIINAGPDNASACTIAPATSIPASFLFQTTNPSTNAVTGSPNTPVNISAGQPQSFVIAFAPTAAFPPTNVAFTFTCANAPSPAASTIGIDTLNLSASTTPVPDVIALAASGDPGYVDIPGTAGIGDFAVATVNLGVDATITAAANTGTATLPVTLTICQTNSSTGACMASPTPTVTTDIPPNATPTFGIFVAGSGTVSNSPGVNRIFVTFTDAGGVLRGETSVAVRTQ
jgi:hypothetical protein